MHEFAEGMYGKVYSDNQGYVYKVFNTEKKENESGWIRELVALKDLNHTNIVSPKYIGFNFSSNECVISKNNIYIKMKKYSPLLNCKSLLSDEDIMQSISDIFSGLAYMHSKLIMHRDIKEANLLYEPSKDENRIIGRMMICDFSLARFTINTSDIKNFNYLTPETITSTHRAPEVFQSIEIEKMKGMRKGKIEYNELVDVWSVGIVMFFLLTGIQLYHAIFYYGKQDIDFINFISKIQSLQDICNKMKDNKNLTSDEKNQIFTTLLLSDQASMCIRRWLNKYINKHLNHKEFFKTIMFECLSEVDKRPSALELTSKISKYIIKNNMNKIVNNSFITDLTVIQVKSPDEKYMENYSYNYIQNITEYAIKRIESEEVKGLILNKITLIMNKFCSIVKKSISELDIKFIIAASHIVEIMFLYEDIFTSYFRYNRNDIYKYINFIFTETNFLEGLF